MSDLYWKHGLYLTGICKCDFCPLKQRCKDYELACKEFEFWANEADTGHDMKTPFNPKPNRDLYRKVFGD